MGFTRNFVFVQMQMIWNFLIKNKQVLFRLFTAVLCCAKDRRYKDKVFRSSEALLLDKVTVNPRERLLLRILREETLRDKKWHYYSLSSACMTK